MIFKIYLCINIPGFGLIEYILKLAGFDIASFFKEFYRLKSVISGSFSLTFAFSVITFLISGKLSPLTFTSLTTLSVTYPSG